MNRRRFLATLASGAAARVPRIAAEPEPSRTSMGVVAYSFSPSPRTRSPLTFLEYCHSLGAGGVQTALDSQTPGDLERLRRRAENLGMYVEALVDLPARDDTGQFERSVVAAKQAGAVCLRAACLSGRRYETFSNLEAWKRFVQESRERIRLAIPVIEKHRLPLGVENHKDWTAAELFGLMRKFTSEYLGVCLDTGNNIALLEEPWEVVEMLAPYAATTHIKDMAVEGCAEGFLLAEVALGEGVLDLPRIVNVIQKLRPRARFSLEMITRDPLKIPCLRDEYWATFRSRKGPPVARALSWVRAHHSARSLPTVSSLDGPQRAKLEEENVRKSLLYAHDQLGLRAVGKHS